MIEKNREIPARLDTLFSWVLSTRNRAPPQNPIMLPQRGGGLTLDEMSEVRLISW